MGTIRMKQNNGTKEEDQQRRHENKSSEHEINKSPLSTHIALTYLPLQPLLPEAVDELPNLTLQIKCIQLFHGSEATDLNIKFQ